MSALQTDAQWFGDDATGYDIGNSLRFRATANTSLSRTPSTSSNRRTWTWSGWIKRGTLGTTQHLFNAWGGSTDALNTSCYFNSANKLVIGAQTVNWRVSSAVFQDVGSWYHVVVCYDATVNVAFGKWKVWVNGVQVVLFDTATDPGDNSDLAVGHNILHRFGTTAYDNTGPFDGYLAEFNFINGLALNPSAFGEVSLASGQWIPKKYEGAYGVNGFYLNFNNGASLSTLGADSSGAGSNWTLNNHSLALGATYDWMEDSPTNNYPTFNSLIAAAGNIGYANANLNALTGAVDKIPHSTFAFPPNGKYYFEWTVGAVGSASLIGISDGTVNQNGGGFAGGKYRFYAANGNKATETTGVAYGATFTTGNVIGVAVDQDDKTLTFYKNGVSQGVAFTDIGSTTWFAAGYINNANGDINFGQRPFSYPMPSGYQKLNSRNLPSATIANPKTQFNTITYVGGGSPPQSVTGVGFKPALMWVKSRSQVWNNITYDKVRPLGYLGLLTDNTGSETTFGSTYSNLLSLDNDGFTAGATTGTNLVVGAPSAYGAWFWRADATEVTNTNGTITASVVANPTAGFSIVKWTGNGAATATLGHGLGVAPKLFIEKARNATGNWPVLFTAFDGSLDFLYLNLTNTLGNASQAMPTSTTIGVRQDAGDNTIGTNYVAYCFSEVEGYSKIASYTGNGAANGPFIYTGFKPAYVMIKRIDGTSDWNSWDSARSHFNTPTALLKANSAGAETAFGALDFTSNGFKIRTTDNSFNGSGASYLYIAFAESPFKTSNAK